MRHLLLFDNINVNVSSSAHHHKPECAVNHCWLIERDEWSVADTERPQPPSDSLLWPDLSIASILSASVSEVLMWAWGTKVTKLIILDDVALPASWSYCSCVANCSFLHHLEKLLIWGPQKPSVGCIFTCWVFPVSQWWMYSIWPQYFLSDYERRNVHESLTKVIYICISSYLIRKL